VRIGRLAIDAGGVEHGAADRLEPESADPARFVIAALGVGARVLDREQTTANTDFVKAEFERAARELDAEFTDRARRVAERLDQKVDEVFGPDHGHVTKALERHFGDESSLAVQNRVKAVLTEVSAQMRDDLRKQFMSDSDANPLAGFQRAILAMSKQSAEQQFEQMRAMNERLEAMRVQMAELKSEKEKLEEVAAEVERGTAKGRTYEESVHEALDAIAHAQGDDCDAVGDLPGVGGRKGDVVVAIDACGGPARGRIVFEAKNSQVPKKRALAELDEAMAARGADYGVFVVPTDAKLPARTPQLREFNGDKLFVVFDPDDESRLPLEVAYSLARARVLMTKGGGDALDADAVRAEVERALGQMEEVRRVKQQLTHATNGIEQARTIIDAMAAQVRAHLTEIGALLDAGSEEPELVE